jgi:hypothetical protein
MSTNLYQAIWHTFQTISITPFVTAQFLRRKILTENMWNWWFLCWELAACHANRQFYQCACWYDIKQRRTILLASACHICTYWEICFVNLQVVELASLDSLNCPVDKLSCLRTTLDLILAELKGAIVDAHSVLSSEYCLNYLHIYVKHRSNMQDLRFSRQWLWRMASSWMLRHVALVRTDVSEEFSASFIRVTKIGELGTTLAVTSNRCKRASVASYS